MKKILFTALIWITLYSNAEVAYGLQELRSNLLWGVGVSGMRHSLHAGDGNEVVGNSVHMGMSGLYLSKVWFVSVTGEMITGPHEPVRKRQLDVGFQGAGGSLLWGYSAQDIDIRFHDGGYGFSLGLMYWDIVGRMVGENRRAVDWDLGLQNRGLISQYTMRANNLVLMPGIFFTWLKPERLPGRTPKELETRIEGYLLNIGIAFPISSSYHARYVRNISLPVRDYEEGSSVEPGDLFESPSLDRGNMDGFTLMVSWTMLLGV